MLQRYALWGALVLGLAPAVLVANPAHSQRDECKNRGQLDVLYCDENGDLVADSPKDPKKWREQYRPICDAGLTQRALVTPI